MPGAARGRSLSPEPATFWVLALISMVSGNITVALRPDTPGGAEPTEGIQEHGGIPVAPMLAAVRWAGGLTWGGDDHFGGQTCQPVFRFSAQSLIDGLLPVGFLAALPLRGKLRQEQWRLAGNQLPENHPQRLAPAGVAAWLEVNHLKVIAEQALLRRQRRSLAVTNVHRPAAQATSAAQPRCR